MKREYVITVQGALAATGAFFECEVGFPVSGSLRPNGHDGAGLHNWDVGQ